MLLMLKHFPDWVLYHKEQWLKVGPKVIVEKIYRNLLICKNH